MQGSLPLNYKSQPTTPLTALRHIPGSGGLPVLGKIPGLYRDFYGTIQHHYELYGLTSRIRLAPQSEGVLALGADSAQTILLDRDKNFSSQMGYADVFQAWFGLPILLRDFDEHRLHRRMFQTAFKSEAMQGYANDINELVDRALGEWQANRELAFVPFMKQLLITISAKIFYGLDATGSQADELARAFLQIFDKGMMGMIKQDIPPLKYYYGQKGKRFVRGYLQSLIEPRRRNPGADFMSYFVHERRDDGEFFSDEELIDHLSFLFFAAFDTTGSGLSHLMMYLAADPALQEQLRGQSLDLNKPFADYGDLKALTDIEYAFNEALRLHPSVPMMMRRNIEACELDGVAIPANTLLFLVPGFNQRMPELWTAPERFDPQRFNDQRQEHKSHPYAFLPFGGGAHKCIGMNMALMSAKLFMHQLLRRYRFRLQPGYRMGTRTIPLPRPNGGLPLVVEAL